MKRVATRFRPPTLAGRIFWAFVVVLLAFSFVSSFAVGSLRRSAQEAEVLRQAYFPLALSVRSLVLAQDTWNSQLNHVTTTDNPADKRAWYDAALRIGRPEMLLEVRAALELALGENSGAPPAAWQELSQELNRAELLMIPDAGLIVRLFDALDREEPADAERTRDALVLRGLKVQRALNDLEIRISRRVDGLVEQARGRERVALVLLIVFASLSLVVGVLMALYARRAVWPLLAITRRAEAVAEGDLSQYPVIETGDEVGRLSQTFEAMVQAIAEAREKLLAAERLGAIGKLAAHVTHEVRNPLSSIGLNLDLLEDELPPENAEVRALLFAIRREVGRLTALSDQYLSMARHAEPELLEADVVELVRGAAAFIRPEIERHGIQLKVVIQEQVPWALVDAGQVQQVLHNLIRNAREALVDHGTITMTVAETSDGVEIAVLDDGPGVASSDLGQVFDPFFTTKAHGTGLGLAVTRQIVEAHAGSLRHERPTSGGARFSVTFPIRKVPSSAPEETK